MLHRCRLVLVVLINACLAAFITPAFADPPSRVGRIGTVDGAVMVGGAEPASLETVSVNYPVAAGMRFSSTAGSRAEFDLGTAAARIDGRTDVEILALDDQAIGLRLTLGSIDIRVRKLGAGERVTVGTSDGQVVLTQAGAYRIDAPGMGASSTGNAPFRAVTHVAVFEGVARIHSPHGSDDVFAGEAVDIDSPHGTLRYGRADSLWLDDWAAGREQDIAAATAESERYADTDIAGVNQLSDAGSWEETPDYGTVWYPDTVAVDWAPYQYGTWTWIAPWGWTWVDDQPWGFAPFHYGRWVRVHGRWGWCPGERHHRHVYAPALVNFVGDHDHNRRVRPNGWVPLGPGESYKPPYTHGDGYVRDINAGHGGRRWDGNSARRDDNRDGNGAAGVITTTMRLPNQGGDNDNRRHRRRMGNDNSAPITITDENSMRRPRSSVLAPVGAVTPMTTNPAGNPPAPVGPSPLAPPVDPSSSARETNGQGRDQESGRRRFWSHRNPDFRNVDPSAPSQTTPTQTYVPQPAQLPVPPPPVVPQPQAIAPPTDAHDMSGVGQVRVPRFTGNTGSMPADGGGYGRFQRPNPAGMPPQMPTAVPTPIPQMVSPPVAQPQFTPPTPVYRPPTPAYQPPTPAYQPPAPAFQPPAATSTVTPVPQPRVADPRQFGGYGGMPPPTGQGNLGQGNTGDGNFGH